MSRTSIDLVRAAFTARGLTPLFADRDYKNSRSKLKYRCRCGGECESTCEAIRLDHESCKNCVRAKIMRTSMDRYGVPCSSQNEGVKRKMMRTNMQKYGTAFSLQNPDVRAKIATTMLERYGVEHGLQSEDLRARAKATLLERYGVEHAVQAPEFHKKQLKSAFRLKTYVLPSGSTIEVQGHESFCLKDLLAEGFTEAQIIRGYEQIPSIQYEFEEAMHVYHPDMFIPSDRGPGNGTIIEVKSTYTLQQMAPRNVAKFRACIGRGYELDLRVYDGKGRRIPNIERDFMALVADPGTPYDLDDVYPIPKLEIPVVLDDDPLWAELGL